MKRTGLARTTPLPRTKPLPRTTATPAPRKPLARTTPMPRTSSPPADRAPKPDRAPRDRAPRKPKARTAPRNTGPSATVRAFVIERDGGLCVRCGKPGTNVHHREGRGMGGASGERLERINQPAWLLTLCGMGNTSGCHGWAEANKDNRAVDLGYVIKRNAVDQDAEAIPVRTANGWRLFSSRLDCDPRETVTRTTAPEGQAA